MQTYFKRHQIFIFLSYDPLTSRLSDIFLIVQIISLCPSRLANKLKSFKSQTLIKLSDEALINLVSFATLKQKIGFE